ncbi:flagellar biosynthesis anti-sigma factor FlgM [Moorella sp. ACPs]|uniref:flagellar biosynthesis anti-sigma factor FlgM n=1 Tax=Neomoorella carbonis TaxID=3062783 RepID=UPI003252D272
MKITGQGPVSWNRVCAAYQQAAGVKGNDRPAQARREEDSVQLSPESRLINDLKTRLAGAEDIRSTRVEAIRAAVASGTYKVSLEELAGAMLKEMGR